MLGVLLSLCLGVLGSATDECDWYTNASVIHEMSLPRFVPVNIVDGHCCEMILYPITQPGVIVEVEYTEWDQDGLNAWGYMVGKDPFSGGFKVSTVCNQKTRSVISAYVDLPSPFGRLLIAQTTVWRNCFGQCND